MSENTNLQRWLKQVNAEEDAKPMLSRIQSIWAACGLDFEELVEEFDKGAEKTGEA